MKLILFFVCIEQQAIYTILIVLLMAGSLRSTPCLFVKNFMESLKNETELIDN